MGGRANFKKQDQLGATVQAPHPDRQVAFLECKHERGKGRTISTQVLPLQPSS